MTKNQLADEIQALKDIANKLSAMATEIAARRDIMRDEAVQLSAGYNMVLRSIEDASVTARTMADVSNEKSVAYDGEFAKA
ncbi:hypothetical protein [Williamsia sp. R60]